MYAEVMWPGAIPARCWAHNLESDDGDLVRESLAFLSRRADPVAVPKALRLLHSSDDYIWLNAAEYLGACKRQEAVPYLIKALRHTAWASDEETVRYLRALTGQTYGADFEHWQAWWTAQHPGERFDWTSSLGVKPRIR
jgi:HEAT repeat protein